MTQNWKSATAALAVTTMLLGTGAQAFAASPEMILKNEETQSEDEVKLPARAVEIVAALEKLEPALKALTVREVFVSEQDENQVVLTMHHPDNIHQDAYIVFDRNSGEMVDFEAATIIWDQTEKATDEAILKKADKAVEELLGAKKRSMTDAPQLSTIVEDSIEFRNVYYPILLNGLEIEGMRFGIDVDMDSAGHLIGISYQPLDLKGIQVGDPKKAVAKETIQKQIFTPERIQHGYVWEGSEGKPGLAYKLRTSPVFDALTGKQIVDGWGEENGEGKLNAADLKNISLKPQAKPFIEKNATDTQILERLFGIDTKKTYSTYRKEEQDGIINHYWANYVEVNYASVVVDQLSGEIGGYLNWTHIPNLPAPLTKEQSLQKAIAFLEPYAKTADWQVEMYERVKPDEPLAFAMNPNQDKTQEKEKSAEQYGFLFFEKQNGIPVMEYSYGVVIEPKKGQVAEFLASVPTEARKYPVLKSSVTGQQVAEIFAKHVPVKLTYIWPTSSDYDAPILAYKLDTSKGWPTVDAVNGSFTWDEIGD
ncbi:hypothetical protein P4V43_25640 [Brevibacillus fortis]|uniref:PepSY domain-containing protein n=1 Tax=Brevibacillus fortis TaxID=2126352 RepID=A0A2P7UFZ0_9BACL|nr:hypothetical protein [Brevibacillus fortis]MED1785208.1 hypothetical protein [Brevibacillus fortis]PSJ85870.1 hypothetical protein C7R93_29250 [Brevibacillus fortis]